jgi:hypothetical protein
MPVRVIEVPNVLFRLSRAVGLKDCAADNAARASRTDDCGERFAVWPL